MRGLTLSIQEVLDRNCVPDLSVTSVGRLERLVNDRVATHVLLLKMAGLVLDAHVALEVVRVVEIENVCHGHARFGRPERPS